MNKTNIKKLLKKKLEDINLRLEVQESISLITYCINITNLINKKYQEKEFVEFKGIDSFNWKYQNYLVWKNRSKNINYLKTFNE